MGVGGGVVESGGWIRGEEPSRAALLVMINHKQRWDTSCWDSVSVCGVSVMRVSVEETAAQQTLRKTLIWPTKAPATHKGSISDLNGRCYRDDWLNQAMGWAEIQASQSLRRNEDMGSFLAWTSVSFRSFRFLSCFFFFSIKLKSRGLRQAKKYRHT